VFAHQGGERKEGGVIVALLMALAATPQVAAAPMPPPASLPTDTVRRSKALELARLLNPESSVIDESGDEYVKATRQLLIARGKLNDLEARYPGVIEAMLRASVATMNAQMHKRVPVLWDRMADIYLDAFSMPELDQLLAFYGSPTGQRIMTSFDRRLKPKAMMNDMVKNDDFSVSVGSLKSDLADTVPGVVRDMTSADKAALMKFMQTSAFRKINATSGRIQQALLSWMQEESPEEADELEGVMSDAMKAYMRKKDSETGPTT
jgi:Uncharacterized protein conserved in bacteria (DUF2059)